jgi:hypothetical protein
MRWKKRKKDKEKKTMGLRWRVLPTYLMENPIKDLANKNKISAHPTILITGERGQLSYSGDHRFLSFGMSLFFSLKVLSSGN